MLSLLVDRDREASREPSDEVAVRLRCVGAGDPKRYPVVDLLDPSGARVARFLHGYSRGLAEAATTGAIRHGVRLH